ncbi:hypothetical protein M758_3G152900 [Ceratodon purpureus]|nr:hypothetical protein M758_3G152900 [Ceratodon purpureus]
MWQTNILELGPEDYGAEYYGAEDYRAEDYGQEDLYGAEDCGEDSGDENQLQDQGQISKLGLANSTKFSGVDLVHDDESVGARLLNYSNEFEQLQDVKTSQQLDTKRNSSKSDNTQPEYVESTINLKGVACSSKPILMATISDVFQVTSDEMFLKVLHDELLKLDYISKLSCNGNISIADSSKIGETNFFFHFNEDNDMFEYYFKDYTSMGRILGVGLEYAKVILEDGRQLKVKELSKQSWKDGLQRCNFVTNTLKVTIPEQQVADMDTISLENLQHDPTQRSLLLDIAKYFVLKTTTDSFHRKGTITTCANNPEGSSSSSQSFNQDYSNSTSNLGTKLFQTLKNLFSMKAFNEMDIADVSGGSLNGKNGQKTKETTVYLELLPGGYVSHSTNLDVESQTLVSQLDNNICSEMQFTFKIDENNRKEIKIVIGPISFQFQREQEENYLATKRFGWFHKYFDVSFRVSNAECAKLCATYKALDVKEVKVTYETSCTDATMNGIARTMDGKAEGSVPQIFRFSLSGSQRWSTDQTQSKSVGGIAEEFIPYTQGGFSITPWPNLLTSTLKYTYLPRDYMSELDHEKLLDDDHRKKVSSLPICIPQDIKFQGTWQPKEVLSVPHQLVEYILEASRVVQTTTKQIVHEALEKKSWRNKIFPRGKHEAESERNDPLQLVQKHRKSVYLNHAMTHFDLNGPKFEYWVRERFNQGLLNQTHAETILTEEGSLNAPSWNGNPLVELN